MKKENCLMYCKEMHVVCFYKPTCKCLCNYRELEKRIREDERRKAQALIDAMIRFDRLYD